MGSCTNIHYHMVTEWCRRVLVALTGPFASKQLFCYTNPELSTNYFWKVLFHFIGLLFITDYCCFLLILSIHLLTDNKKGTDFSIPYFYSWLKLPILILLDPSMIFWTLCIIFWTTVFQLVLLVNITNIEVYSPIVCGINIFSVNLHT